MGPAGRRARRERCDTRAVFVLLLTGPPGAGKTVALSALSDSLVDDGVPHAAVDADEVAWAYPFPDLTQRCEHLRAWHEPHARAGRELLVVAEVIESPAHLADVLAALGADAHLLVSLEAAPATLRDRIVAREPPGWHGLAYLLGEVEPLCASLAALERGAPAARQRAAWPGADQRTGPRGAA